MKNAAPKHLYLEGQYRFVPQTCFGYKVLVVDWERSRIWIQSEIGVTLIHPRGVLESSVPLTENLI